jgi:transcriptional regulator with PAS, ATPase and Fis domain
MMATKPYAPHAWVHEFPAAVTVCDAQGIVLEMNLRAEEMFKEDGGKALVGTNLLECHPDEARAKLEAMLASHKANVYTIEKNGLKTLIYQTPWYLDDQFAGFIEMALEIPLDMPHYVRTP